MKAPRSMPGDFSGDVPEYTREEEARMLKAADAELRLRKRRAEAAGRVQKKTSK